MTLSGQLNIHSYKNLHSREVQTVHLFDHDEMHAELVVLPPQSSIEWHTHADQDELFDVVEGEGELAVEERVYHGVPGKCVFVPAGEAHRLVNPHDTPWVLRVTYHDRLTPRHFGRLLRRALRQKLRMG